MEKPFISEQEDNWAANQEHAFSDIYCVRFFKDDKQVSYNLCDYRTEEQLLTWLREFRKKYGD